MLHGGFYAIAVAEHLGVAASTILRFKGLFNKTRRFQDRQIDLRKRQVLVTIILL